MKLSAIAQKLTCMKSNAFRVLALATAAGAALAVAPVAQAQHFAVGVQVGAPTYYAPAPAYGHYGNDRYDRLRYDEWRRHEARSAWERNMRYEDWRRDHRYDAYRARRFDHR